MGISADRQLLTRWGLGVLGHRRSWPGKLLTLAAGATPVVAALAPLGLIIVLSISAIGIGVLRVCDERSLSLPRPLLAFLVVFTLWSGISILWTIDQAGALALLQSVLSVTLGGIVLIATASRLSGSERSAIERWFLIGFVGALLLLGALAIGHAAFDLNVAAGAGLSRTVEWFLHNRSIAAFALLLWPATFVTGRRYGRGAALALAISTAGIFLGFDSTAASLSLLAGGAAALLGFARPRLTAALLGVAVVAGTALMPLLPSLIPVSELASRPSPTAVYHRLMIWDFAAKKITEKPLLGWGFNASRALPGGDTEVIHHPSGHAVPLMPLHPHNGILQLWIELGLPGAVLGVALMVIAILGIGKRLADRAWRSAAFAHLGAGLTMVCLSFGIWQRWWMSALWLSAVLMLSVVAPPPPETSEPARAMAA